MMPWRSVNIGDTTVDAVVLGDQSPTVVFVNGLGAPAGEWSLVAPDVAKRVRVVLSDRRPAPATGRVAPHPPSLMADDLDQLLRALDAPGPYVLVGHSWGGIALRVFAAAHPRDVVGLVFVDATPESTLGMMRSRFSTTSYWAMLRAARVPLVRRFILNTMSLHLLPDAERQRAESAFSKGTALRTAWAEYLGAGSAAGDLGTAAGVLPDVPIRVLVAGGHGRLTRRLVQKYVREWEAAAARLADARVQFVPDSGHYISIEHPGLVTEAVFDVLNAVGAAKEAAR